MEHVFAKCFRHQWACRLARGANSSNCDARGHAGAFSSPRAPSLPNSLASPRGPHARAAMCAKLASSAKCAPSAQGRPHSPARQRRHFGARLLRAGAKADWAKAAAFYCLAPPQRPVTTWAAPRAVHHIFYILLVTLVPSHPIFYILLVSLVRRRKYVIQSFSLLYK